MKTIKNIKKEFLFNNEYWKREHKISERDYEIIYDENEKGKFTERDAEGNYIRPECCPEISDDEIMQLVCIETHEKVSALSDAVNTIKACMIFFVVLQILSIIGAIIMLLNLF